MIKLLRTLWTGRRPSLALAALALAVGTRANDPVVHASRPAPARQPVTFVFTSDVHYGLNRSYFRGAANVEARVVDAALAEKINRLPAAVLPADGGLRAGQPVGPVDFVVVTGDIANRQELYPLHIQSATVSWQQFEDGFIKPLAVTDAQGRPAPLLRVDYIFQGVYLPAGGHEVVLEYAPPTGALKIQLAGLFVCLGAALWVGFRRLRKGAALPPG